MHLIRVRDQVCNVMASLTKTFVSPDIVPQNCTTEESGTAGHRLSQIQLGGSDNRCTMADGKAMVHHHFHLKS